MRMNVRIARASAFAIALILPLLVMALGPAARAADGVDGVWLTQAGDAKVAVSRCGSGLCGRVVWLRDPIDPATKKAQVDDKNENPKLRTRPIIGIALFLGMKGTGPNAWAGQIYNADDGKTYASTVKLTDSGQLEVRGCAGPLCGTENWSRSSR